MMFPDLFGPPLSPDVREPRLGDTRTPHDPLKFEGEGRFQCMQTYVGHGMMMAAGVKSLATNPARLLGVCPRRRLGRLIASLPQDRTSAETKTR
jgi:hypothetical protein